MNNAFFIRLPQVKEITGLSRSTIYRKIAAGEFPKQHSIGANLVVWLREDIETWCKQMIASAAV